MLLEKNRYNNTPVVDGIHGNSEIANVFKSKFSALYSSVPTTTEAMESLNENIDSNVRNHCTDNANDTNGHTHCHVIEKNHVQSAIDKLKSFKVLEKCTKNLIGHSRLAINNHESNIDC